MRLVNLRAAGNGQQEGAPAWGTAPPQAGTWTGLSAFVGILQQAIIEHLVSRIRDMEAEQLNSISNKLDDLAQRAAELRRYL
ncbi:MAG TPA: hypothetical protein VJ576_19895 [Rhodocyclaceae bacterium]|nr:hypothetical protein [Rhodocyclaceae bacterium]